MHAFTWDYFGRKRKRRLVWLSFTWGKRGCVGQKKSYIFNDHIVVSTDKDLEPEIPTLISRDKIRTTIIGSNQSLEVVGCSG